MISVFLGQEPLPSKAVIAGDGGGDSFWRRMASLGYKIKHDLDGDEGIARFLCDEAFADSKSLCVRFR